MSDTMPSGSEAFLASTVLLGSIPHYIVLTQRALYTTNLTTRSGTSPACLLCLPALPAYTYTNPLTHRHMQRVVHPGMRHPGCKAGGWCRLYRCGCGS